MEILIKCNIPIAQAPNLIDLLSRVPKFSWANSVNG